jgi:hypothetical protein
MKAFEISCRVGVYALAAEHLNDDDAPEVERSAIAALPVALSEIKAELQALADQLTMHIDAGNPS